MCYGDRAVDLFKEGYNCAQAVAVAFSDVMGMEEKTVARMVSSFGGGMGRMREVCGAVSGMFFALGYLYGYDDPADDKAKMELYGRVQALAAQFREEHGNIVCRELLKNPASDPAPTPRNAEFYAKRPCARFVYTAAEVMAQFIQEHPLEQNNG